MATVLGLNIKFAANTAGISKGAQRTSEQLRSVQKSAASASSALRSLVAIDIAKILASGFSSVASAIGGYIGNIRTTIDATAKLSQRTGIAVEALQSLQVAAGLSGVQNLDGAIQRLTITIGDAAQGNKAAQDAFARLGMSYEDLAGIAPEDQFRAIAKAISGLPSAAERAAAAADLFGRTGVELLPLFASNLEEVEARANRLGIVLSGPQTKAIEDMNDALSLVYQTFQGIIGQVVANLAPAVTAIAEEFLQFVEGYNGLGEGTGGNALADSITLALLEGAEYIALAFDTALQYLGVFTDVMTQVGKGFMIAMDFFYKTYELLNAAFYSLRISLNEWIIAAVKGLTEIVSYIPGAGDIAQFGEFFAQDLQRSVESDRKAQETALENFASGLTFEDFGADSQGPAGRLVDDLRARFEASQAARGQGQGEARGGGGGFDSSALEEARRLAEEQARLEEQRLKKIADLNEQYADKSEEIERNRLDALGRANQQALEATDIRSGGIGQVLALATGREDPAIAEARKQLDELQNISREIRKLGGTVELVGAA